MRVIFRCLVFFCVLSAVGITPASAHFDYPFGLIAEVSGAEQQLVARNDGPAPVSVYVTLSEQIFASDHTWPITAVIPPYTALPLAHVYAASESADGREFQFRYNFGRLDAVHDEKVAYRLPFEEGRSFAITQAYGGKLTSHSNFENLYAVDFAMPPGTPVVAARGGILIEARLHHHEGGHAVNDWDKANTVSILHEDGTVAEYAHLSPGAAIVGPGQRVEAGQLIGYSGNTGYSSGPHLHFVVYKPAVTDGKMTRRSLPVVFYDYDPPVRFSAKAGTTVTASYKSVTGARFVQARQDQLAHAGSSFRQQPPDRSE